MIAFWSNFIGKIFRQHRLKSSVIFLSIFCGLANFEFARTTYQNADNVQSFNELSSIVAGNYLLHGWSLASDNFYFTDLPFYVLCRTVFGLRPALVYIVPFIVFMFFLMACVLIARQTGKTQQQRDLGSLGLLALLGFPFTPLHDIFLQSATHTATIAFCCWGFYFGQRFLARPRVSIWPLVPFCIAIFAATASDPQAIFYSLGPLLILVFARCWLYGRFIKNDWLLAGYALAAGVYGMTVISYISAQGGFSIAKSYSLDFVSNVPALGKNTFALLQALRITFDARPALINVPYGSETIAFSRCVAWVASAALCLRILWRMPRAPADAAAQWLVFAVLFLATADALSGTFAGVVAASTPGWPVFAVRYVVPIYVCMVLAAVIEGQDFAAQMAARSEWRALRVAALVAATLAIFYFTGIIQATVRAVEQPDYQTNATQYRLANWLRAHHLSYGVGDYWTTQTLTAWGYGAVTADPVTPINGRLSAWRFVGDMSRLDAGRRPQFVVFTPINQWHITLDSVVSTYGQPVNVAKFEGVVVAILQ